MVLAQGTSETSRSETPKEEVNGLEDGPQRLTSDQSRTRQKEAHNTTIDIEKHPGGDIKGHSDGDIEKTPSGNGAPLATTPTESSQLPLSKARTISLVITLTGAAFLNTLSVQACVIILPTIGTALSIPPARQQWVVSAYSLTFGCFLLLWGRSADVYGKLNIFIYGSAWVCLVTVICPFIPNEVGFEIFRGLQGLGAAANVPTAIGILGVTFQPGRAKNYAFAMYSAGAPMGSVIGNMLGGVVGQYATWKAVFWVLAGLAAVITIAGHFVIPVPQVVPKDAQVKHAVDWPGGAVVTVGLVVLLFALTEGNVVGWSQPYIPVLVVVSVLLVAAFVCWQIYLEKRTSKRPLMKVSIFENMRVSAAMAVMALFFAAFNNFLIFATYFYQDYQGHDAIETTVRFIPTGVVGVMTIFVSSQILARISVNYILMFGTLCCSISCLLFAVPIAPSTTYWAYGFPAMCLSVFGADTLFPALLLLTAHSLPREDQAIGGALINAVGQIGRAIGLAIATAIQVAVQESKEDSSAAAKGTNSLGNASFLSGLRSAEWFSFAMSISAFIIATACFRQVGKVGASKK
ncbi:Low affinity ammonium transporter [Fulvia fulva]|uniref:Low affinity ammonium transporter n=1 Tax=Passalora fulva TaxID=5499 RepID=A0A9Q8LFD6_PASFU|nr:Low affinity ammonium transporter [Fulvia fulva]UJO16398.1 Low affinity ammonium transporter [Fulvia fulva]WPV29153.1 Low affinity ammonium transporter [Fulvia fulva]